MKKIVLTTLLLLLLLPFTVHAKMQREYYVNEQNVRMTMDQYSKLVEVYGKESVDSMPQNVFDREKNINYVKIGEETKYVKVVYQLNQFGNVIGTEETEISKEDYDKVNPAACKEDLAKSNPTHETSYKLINISMYGANPGPDGGYTAINFILTTNWKIIPSTRSYDVTGLRFHNFNINLSTIWGTLRYSSDGNTYNVQNYTTASSGFNAPGGDYGFGISMKLPSSTSIIYLRTQVSATGNYTDLLDYGAYGSYQHATSNVSESQSKLYTISSTGMGQVFKFANSVASYYDNTQGVSTGGLYF
ncbi:MAG: hypothetical protein IKN87_04720 [Bacilli bacterium]|nr:hypothetical protein [Bacilli bacterium]